MKPVKLKLLPNSQVRVFYDNTQEVKKARGKLFKPGMIKAIREGRKTQTRRFTANDQPGDLIYVKEAVIISKNMGILNVGTLGKITKANWQKYGKWKSPLFMPREAARYWLLCTGRREERLQDISEEDAKAEGAELWPIIEGVTDDDQLCYRNGFVNLWDSINTKPGVIWKDNPVVQVITFRLFFTGRAEP